MRRLIGTMVVVIGSPIILCGIVGAAMHHAFLVGVEIYYVFAHWWLTRKDKDGKKVDK